MMKTMRQIVSLLLAVVLLVGVTAGADAAAADTVTYAQAVDLLEDIVTDGQSVLDPIGGKTLGGKATQALTMNEAVAVINAFHLDGRSWEPVQEDRTITGEDFFQLVDRMLCTEGWFARQREKNAQMNHYLTGLCSYEEIAGREITREEACQVLMNAMTARVQFAGTWYLREELDLTQEVSVSDGMTDLWRRPVSRWLRNGSPVTAWRTMPASYDGQATINTHELLELLGYYEGGEHANNQWINFHCYSNGGSRWDCGKLHWNHQNHSGCHQNWISNRPSSRMEVYYLGEGVENIPDAGGDVNCQIYHVVFVDDYLAKIENQRISIFSNEDGAVWSWHDTSFPTVDGYYIVRINLKLGNDRAKAFVVQQPVSTRSSLKGAELPGSDGYSYVFTEEGKVMLSAKCQLGFDLIAGSKTQKNQGRVTVLYDTWGNVAGVLDVGFLDVAEDAWYREAVRFVDETGLMTGTSATGFAPEAATTRAMIWTILARMDGVNTDGEVWYEAGQTWAMENGVSDGSNPGANISREQMVTMLWRNAGEPKAETTLDAFTDSGRVSDWAMEAMCWAVEAGVIQGSGGKLNPAGSATRAEVAAMLMRYES